MISAVSGMMLEARPPLSAPTVMVAEGLWVHLPGNEHVQSRAYLGGDVHRIHGFLRLGGVASLTLDTDNEGGHCPGGHAGGVVQLAHLHLGAHVEGHGSVHPRVLQQAVLHHGAGAVAHLLARLEHELHGAGQLVLHLLEDAGRPQQHGCVGVVPTHVSRVPLGREVQAGGLLHGQAVHIRPEQDARSALPDDCHHAGGSGGVGVPGKHHLLPVLLGVDAAVPVRNPHLGRAP